MSTSDHRSSNAEEGLRALVRSVLADAGLSQAAVAGRLDLSTKHLSQMLNGRAHLTLWWAEQILALCGRHVELAAVPTNPEAEAISGVGGRTPSPLPWPWAKTIWSSDAGATIHIPATDPDGDETDVLTVTASDVPVLAAMLGDRFGRRPDIGVPPDAFDRLVRVAAYVSIGRSAVDHNYPDATARYALGALDDAGLLPPPGKDNPAVVHACPRPGTGITPCCNRRPLDLPRGERITTVPDAVTCTASAALTETVPMPVLKAAVPRARQGGSGA